MVVGDDCGDFHVVALHYDRRSSDHEFNCPVSRRNRSATCNVHRPPPSTPPATAWRNIDYAADHPDVGAGDWVYVGPGTYDEEVTPTNDGTASAPIRFIADTDGSKTTDPPGTVEITDSGGTRNVLSIVGNDYYEFVGFRLSSGRVLNLAWALGLA